MPKIRSGAAGAFVVIGLIAQHAPGAVVADYNADFQYPTPAPGWSYLWNANGPVGSAANYAPLVGDSAAAQRYETQDQTPDAFPDAPPGAGASASATTLIPGHGSAQTAVPRFAIAAYTFSAADLTANGGELSLDNYVFNVSAASGDGINAKIYRNDTLLVNRELPPGLVFSSDLPPEFGGGPVPLGPVVAGDTIYVAIGADGPVTNLPTGELNPLAGTDTGDSLGLDYSLVLVPEPGSAALLGLAALGLLARRRKV
jgi:hypothetical protein